MPRYQIDVTLEIESPNEDEAWATANDAADFLSDEDLLVVSVSEPWKIA